jgi:hypothetical protein
MKQSQVKKKTQKRNKEQQVLSCWTQNVQNAFE